LRTNVVVLAKVAKLAKIPLIPTASVPDGPNGPLMHELHEVAPDTTCVPTKGEISAWDDEDFVREVDMCWLSNETRWRRWAPLPLRLVIGYGFVAHGWAKLSRGPAEFASLLEQIGAPFPEVTAWMSTFLEILGGLAILAGALVTAVSIPLIVMMLVALFTVHLQYGFSAVNTVGLTADGPQFSPPGIEVNLLYVAGLLALILQGSGPFSIDRLPIRRQRESAASPS
jgi:putative oxidoreductase